MQFSRLRPALTCLALFLAAPLAGCGFSPLYSENGAGAALSQIQVETGEDRVDYLLERALYDSLGSSRDSGAYILRTETLLGSDRLGVGADDVATRYAVVLGVRYQLVRISDDAVLHTGRTTGRASYDVTAEVYGAISAEQDAEARAAEHAADRLTAQLARVMARLPQ